MEILPPSRTVLKYLYKQREEKGNVYGNIAHHAGFKTWEEVKELCKTLYDNGLAEWKNERIFITDEGRLWIERYMEAQEDRIREYVYDDYEFALLRFLYELDQPLAVDDFPEVLKEEAPKYTNGSSAYNLIHILEIEFRSYVHNPQNKYELKVAGRKRFEHLVKSKGVQLNSPQDQANTTFSEQDKNDLSNKIDKVLSELEKLQTGHEIIWTDMKEELDELKEMYHLNKKNWRQLLTGKITEMLAGGIVSEAISKKIVDSINPTIEKLLE